MTDLRIRRDQHVAIIGMNGAGKSYFARAELSYTPRLVVFDPKGLIISEPEWNLVKWADGIKRLENGRPARLWVPPLDDPEEYEEYFFKILSLRNLRVYIDELYGVGPALGSKGLRALYTRGRQLGISMWSSFQRPRFVPVFALSEAYWKVLFRLEMEPDRIYMADNGFGEIALRRLADHAFLLKDPKGRVVSFPNGITVVEGLPLDTRAG